MKGYHLRFFRIVLVSALSLVLGLVPKSANAQSPTPSTCLEWNSFLGPVENIYETANFGGSPANVTGTLYDLSGAAQGSVNYSVAAGGQTDIIASQLAGYHSDSYGLLCAASSANLSGRVLVYKIAPGSESAPQFQFAYAVEDAALKGTQFVSFNTIQPSLAAKDASNFVANWIQVSNPSTSSSTTYTGRLVVYDFNGHQITSANLQVPAGGRVDFGVHDVAPHTIGLVAWQPDDSTVFFQVRNVRYVYDNVNFAPSFETAFQLSGAAPSNELVATPFDTLGSDSLAQDAVLELVNAGSASTTARVKFYDASGQLLTDSPFTVALEAHASQHIVIDSLFNNHRGLATIEGENVLATVMQYGRRADGGIYTMYGVAAKAPVTGALYGSYNTYLSQSSEVWMLNVGAADVANVSVTRSDGTVRAGHTDVSIPAYGLKIFNVNSVEDADHYGVVRVEGDANAAWVFRRRSNEYVVPLPLNVSSAPAVTSSSTSRTTTTGTSAITAPVSGATVSGTVNAQAQASVSPGSVSKVKFDILDSNSHQISSTDITYPYNLSWNSTSVSDGSYYVRIRVYSDTTKFEVSSLRKTISINVKNATPPSGPVCGNNKCESGETTSSCPADCHPAAVCGNGTCESGETASSCAIDCHTKLVCGDTFCDAGETCTADCGSPAQCGDGFCDIPNGETQFSCAEDCASAPGFTKTMHMYRKGSPYLGSSGTDAEKAQYAAFYTSTYQMLEPGYGTGNSKLSALQTANPNVPMLNYQKVSGIKSQSGVGCCTSGNCALAGDVDDQIYGDAVKYNLFLIRKGMRVVNPDNGWCYADLTGAASSDDATARGGKTKLAKWIEVLGARVAGKMNATNIDGVFLDNSSIPFDGYAATSDGVTLSFYSDSTLMNQWYNGIRQVVAALRQLYPSKLIIVNAYSSSGSVPDNERGFEIVDVADGILSEETIFHGSGSFWDFTRFSRIIKDLNDIAHGRRLTNGAKQVIQMDDSVPVADTTKRYYALAAYLMIEGEKVMYAPFYGDSDITNLPEFHLDLGAPSNEYTIDSTTGLMTRTFAKGTVVLNPNKTGAAISVNTSNKHKLTISGGGAWSPTNSNSGTLSWSTALPATYSLQPNEALIFN